MFTSENEGNDIEIPLFCLSSTVSFQEKSVGETNIIRPSGERVSEVLEKLTEGMAESDLILIAPVDNYEIIQQGGDEPGEKIKKPDKNNHQCRVFAAPEYTQYTILTKKCACGGQLKKNNWGDEMTKCGGKNCSSYNDNVNGSGKISGNQKSNGPSLLISMLIGSGVGAVIVLGLAVFIWFKNRKIGTSQFFTAFIDTAP
nr:12608_t:CDS:2 [Entrophospora candida]